MEYYIYHIPKVKIGCTNNINRRIREQGFTDYEVLEIHTDKDVAGQREFELQKQYGYKVDGIRYSESVKRINKASKISALTKHEWLPKVDWKAREEKVDKKTKWEKVKSSSAYINMDRSAIAFKAQAKRRKTILQYDLDGNFIKEWKCGANQMFKNFGFHGTGEAARKKSGTIGGYQWRYKEDDTIPNKIKKYEK